jgi:hypothetical protein
VRSLVHDNVRLRLKDRCRQRICVEDVDHDGSGAEIAEEFAVLSRTCRTPDRMAMGQKKGREPAANNARRAS